MKRILTDFLSLSVYIRMIRVDPCSIYDWLSSHEFRKKRMKKEAEVQIRFILHSL